MRLPHVSSPRPARKAVAPPEVVEHLGPLRLFAAGVGVIVVMFTMVSLLAATVPAVWGWTPRVVLSGSMEPAISAGDVALISRVDPKDVRTGTVVLADMPGQPGRTYLHRVVDISDGRLITRGDANRTNDNPPLEPQALRGQTRMVVPLAGWPMLWLLHPTPLRTVAGLVVLGLLVASILAIRPLYRPGGARRGSRGRPTGRRRRLASSAAPR